MQHQKSLAQKNTIIWGIQIATVSLVLIVVFASVYGK